MEKKSKELSPEASITFAGTLRILVMVVFPLGYIYYTQKNLPWPMLAWGLVMVIIAIYGPASRMTKETREEGRKLLDEIIEEEEGGEKRGDSGGRTL